MYFFGLVNFLSPAFFSCQKYQFNCGEKSLPFTSWLRRYGNVKWGVGQGMDFENGWS